jgi:hypothetical protein
MGHAKLFAISETILLLLFRIVNKKSQISMMKSAVFYIFFIVLSKSLLAAPQAHTPTRVKMPIPHIVPSAHKPPPPTVILEEVTSVASDRISSQKISNFFRQQNKHLADIFGSSKPLPYQRKSNFPAPTNPSVRTAPPGTVILEGAMRPIESHRKR